MTTHKPTCSLSLGVLLSNQTVLSLDQCEQQLNFNLCLQSSNVASKSQGSGISMVQATGQWSPALIGSSPETSPQIRVQQHAMHGSRAVISQSWALKGPFCPISGSVNFSYFLNLAHGINRWLVRACLRPIILIMNPVKQNFYFPSFTRLREVPVLVGCLRDFWAQPDLPSSKACMSFLLSQATGRGACQTVQDYREPFMVLLLKNTHLLSTPNLK